MKKSLLLATVLTLGLTGSVSAANPFSDVPAGHWAYGSIAKLAAAGVIDGYPDGSFQGDKLMTRYEMAQIVARAMAKGAKADRLASEFAEELDALGVRVAKLEKKADNVRITGQVRYSYQNTNYKNDATGGEQNAYLQNVRSRLWFTGTVNEDWQYVSMLENTHNFNKDMGVGTATSISTEDGEGTAWQRAFLKGRLGGLKVKAGRDHVTMGDTYIWSQRFDGIWADYGKKVRVGAYYGRPTNQNSYKAATGKMGENFTWAYDKAWGVNAAGDIGKLTISAAYDKFTNPTSASTVQDDDGIWSAGMKYNFGEATLAGKYFKSSLDYKDRSNKGFVINATYKGAKAAKVGSFGLAAGYMDMGVGTFLTPSPMQGDLQDQAFFSEGFKGYDLGAYYTVAKGMVAGLEWWDLKGKESNNKVQTIWSTLYVTF